MLIIDRSEEEGIEEAGLHAERAVRQRHSNCF